MLSTPKRFLSTAALSLGIAIHAAVAPAQETPGRDLERSGGTGDCPSLALPAYGHNDYANRQPLTEALALGYRGVEVDVFLINGVLRVGHDLRTARRGAVFDSLYLQPLRKIVARCRARAGQAILLNVEVKETSPETAAAVRSLMARYADVLFPSDASVSPTALTVVLVGTTDNALPLTPTDSLLGTQCRLVRITSLAECSSQRQLRLLSLDYGKTMGRWWVTSRRRREWLAMLALAKAQWPHLLLRAYNVPARSVVYRQLLDAGVDLIGTKTLADTKRLLSEVRPGTPSPMEEQERLAAQDRPAL